MNDNKPPALGGNRPPLVVKPAKSRGRPRKSGSRNASGRLNEKVDPNPIVMARRLAIASDPTKASCPLDAAVANGWLSPAESLGAEIFIGTHRSAGLGGPSGFGRSWEPSIGSGAADDLNFMWSELTDAQVRAMRWSDLSKADIARIWDSALPVQGGTTDGSKSANRRWRTICSALTPAQREAVSNFCVLELWPRWLERRLNGKPNAGGPDLESLRTGLRAVLMAVRTRKPENDNIQAANDQVEPIGVYLPSMEGKPEHTANLAFTDSETGEVIRTVRVERKRRWKDR